MVEGEGDSKVGSVRLSVSMSLGLGVSVDWDGQRGCIEM